MVIDVNAYKTRWKVIEDTYHKKFYWDGSLDVFLDPGVDILFGTPQYDHTDTGDGEGGPVGVW